MRIVSLRLLAGLAAMATVSVSVSLPAYSQTPAATDQAAAAAPPAAEEAPALLSDDELEVLVARIALYPDELVAAISAASLFPLQIVEAARFLEAKKKDDKLKPKSDWDGSVISLLNYPDIIKMMSEDLDWTQSLADALTNQQKDVLIAIQQLRDEAVEKNIVKTDDKITIVNENDNIIIKPTDPQKVYIPQYPPEMLYQPNYQPAPVGYYPNYYDSYYYPGAGFFAAAVTGAAWAAVVNWDDWGVWGGDWDGDVDIDCNNCLNNIKGKVNWNDVDWKNVDRSKLSIAKDQLGKLDRSQIQSRLQADNRNQLKNKLSARQGERVQGARTAAANRAADIRKGTAEGLKGNARDRVANAGANRPAANRPAANRPNADRAREARANRPAADRPNRPRPQAGNRPNTPRMAARPDNRGRPNALGNVQSGRREAIASKRGGASMGGGHRGGPRMHAGGGQRAMPARGGGRNVGGRGGGRGGGGRGGRR